MKPLFFAVLLVGVISAYEDRECAGDLSNLWLDVVVLVDKSSGMDGSDLIQVSNNVMAVFLNGTKIGTNYSDPRSTRVSIVTYNSNATIVADLNTYQSTDDLINGLYGGLGDATTIAASDLRQGLAATANVLSNRVADRMNYKQAIIIYASEYSSVNNYDPKPAADRLKAADVQIITVAVDHDNDRYLRDKLSQIASPGFNFSTVDSNLVGEVQGALLQINCFCPELWTQYRADYNDHTSHKYGVCVRMPGIPGVWNAAKFACQNLASTGFLVSEFNQQKHDFVFNVVKNDQTMSDPYMYHIGLNRVKGVWSWQQAAGQSVLPAQNYTDWNLGYPTDYSSDSGVLNTQSGADLVVGWQNVSPYTASKNYVCESQSCDTTNYCS